MRQRMTIRFVSVPSQMRFAEILDIQLRGNLSMPIRGDGAENLTENLALIIVLKMQNYLHATAYDKAFVIKYELKL